MGLGRRLAAGLATLQATPEYRRRMRNRKLRALERRYEAELDAAFERELVRVAGLTPEAQAALLGTLEAEFGTDAT
jgi:hypothetical protein